MRLPDLTGPTVDAVKSAQTYLTDLVTPTVRLGVTGLSRAGKTIFITALVRSLTTGQAMPHLPTSKLQGFRAYLEPQPDDDVPRFEYERHLDLLGGDPARWPDSTRRISQLRITLEWQAADWPRRTVGLDRRLHIDIVDYPGEWLLDLALLDQSYAEWSATALEGIEKRTRDGRLEAWLAFLNQCDPAATDAEQTAIRGAELFTAFLASLRDNDAFARTVTPGRFLMPGDLAGSPLLSFFPMRNAQPHSSTPGTLAALLDRRFES